MVSYFMQNDKHFTDLFLLFLCLYAYRRHFSLHIIDKVFCFMHLFLLLEYSLNKSIVCAILLAVQKAQFFVVPDFSSRNILETDFL